MFVASWAATAGHAAGPTDSAPFPVVGRFFAPAVAATAAAKTTRPSTRRAFVGRIAFADDSEEGPRARPFPLQEPLRDRDPVAHDEAAHVIGTRVEGDALLQAVSRLV